MQAICEGEPNLAGCGQCDMTMTDSWAMCSDYLTTLATLCQGKQGRKLVQWLILLWVLCTK